MNAATHTRHYGLITLLALLPAGCSSEAATGPTASSRAADAPDDAVREVVERLAAKDATVLYDAAPPSYRQDIEKVVELARKNVGKKLYDTGAAVAVKLTRVLTEKKAFILAHPLLDMFLQAPQKQALAQGYDDMVEVITALVNSDLRSHDRLKSFEIESFLAQTGNAILTISARAQAGAASSTLPLPDPKTVLLVERKDDKAIIEWTTRAGTTQKDLFAKIEGKWIPVSLHREWTAGIASIREQLRAFAPNGLIASAADQETLTTQLLGYGSGLDQLLAADTQMKFNAKLGKLIQPLLSGR